MLNQDLMTSPTQALPVNKSDNELYLLNKVNTISVVDKVKGDVEDSYGKMLFVNDVFFLLVSVSGQPAN